MISICLEHIRGKVSLGVQGNLEAKLPAITQICWDVHVKGLWCIQGTFAGLHVASIVGR